MKKYKFFLIGLILVTLLVLANKNAKASEGTAELVSTTGANYRCFVASIRMQGGEYRMPFSCRNIEYPVDNNIYFYVMWGNPVSGGDAVKLGELNRGAGEFRNKANFSSLFVTTETKKDIRQPQGEIVMEGDIQPIAFLVEEPTPTPTPEETPTAEETPTEEQPQVMTTRDKLFLALKRAGIAALLALVTLVGLVFVVTRSRG